jgi:hypothetical protein
MGALLRAARNLILVAIGMAALVPLSLMFPYPFFPYFTERGRITLYSDAPFDAPKAQALLARIDARLSRSVLDSHNGPRRIFVANDEWHERLVFALDFGVGGVNYAPLTRNVFLRHSDIDHDVLFGPSGKPVAPPRTFTYFAAHEIAHSLTAEHLGPLRLWNWRLPVWEREGAADYVGLGSKGAIDVDTLYARYKNADPHFDPKSGYYDLYRMLVAYLLDRKGWTMDQLLGSDMSMADAEKLLSKDRGLGVRKK